MAGALLPNAVAAAAGPAQAPPVGIVGHWSDQRFSYDLHAISTASGVQGSFTITNVNTGNVFGGPITQIVPPSGTQDFFCVSGPFTINATSPAGEVFYLKPGGNGPGTVSQWTGESGGGSGGGIIFRMSCASNPAPPGEFETLTPPDFIKAIPAGG
jgi:hypothetical protein